MSDQKPDAKKKPPEISPYLFPILLAAFGLWCFYDGWLTTDPEMQKHALFNRVASGIMLPWSVYDFIKVRRYARKKRENPKPADTEPAP